MKLKYYGIDAVAAGGMGACAAGLDNLPEEFWQGAFYRK
jgi:hypothetical protein